MLQRAAQVEHARLPAPFEGAIAPYCDAWQLRHPGRPHAPTVGLHDNSPNPPAPFTFDFVCVSEELAPRVREMRVDERSNGSAHQPILVELA